MRPQWAKQMIWVWDPIDVPEVDDAIWSEIEQITKDALCARFGHEIEDDQCRIREHRFCVWCGRRFPNVPVGEYWEEK